MTTVPDHSGSTWWHTVLAIPVAFIAFVPLLFLFGIFNLISSFFVGDEGLVSPWARAIQYAFAAGTSLGFPYLFLKRIDIKVAASIFASTLIILFLVTIVILFPTADRLRGLSEWLQTIASIVGIGVGAGAAASAIIEEQRKRRHHV